MRKLYHTKGKIHPSPPPSSTTTTDHHLSLLPFAIATLAATLPPQDQQVLAYLLSISATTTNNNNNNNKYSTGKATTKSGSSGDHAPQFKCNCFRCYTSFWVRWDASPNRKVIHEILDAYEDGLAHNNNNKKNSKSKKERKSNNNNNNNNININNSKCFSSSLALASPTTTTTSIDLHAPPCTVENTSQELLELEQRKMDGGDEKGGSVRKIVSFIGERIWGVWGV